MSKIINSYPPNGLSPVALTFPQWIQIGLGDEEYICPERKIIFSTTNPPEDLPDLSKHFSYMAKILKSKPELYSKLKQKKTAMGIGLADCIKSGIDDLGHELLPNCGIIACDQESYHLFRDLFEPIIHLRHDGYTIGKMFQSDASTPNLNPIPIDPTGRYVLTSRIRCVRSINGYRLPAAVTFEERRSIEKIVVQALMNLDSSLAGDYYPLTGSRSYDCKPYGMPPEQKSELQSSGFLFQDPDNTMVLSSGICRHWPDARGIFVNKDSSSFVWVNEEDHLRIITMEKGQDIQGVFSRNIFLTKAIETELKKMGKEFMFDSRLGFISSCPSNVGTGMRIGCHLKIPRLSSRSDFKSILRTMGLQARGKGGVFCGISEGIVDVSNACRIGKTEVEYANMVMEGVLKIIHLERKLERGEKVDY